MMLAQAFEPQWHWWYNYVSPENMRLFAEMGKIWTIMALGAGTGLELLKMYDNWRKKKK